MNDVESALLRTAAQTLESANQALIQSQLALQMVTAMRRALASISPQLDAAYLEQMEKLQSAIAPESPLAQFQEELRLKAQGKTESGEAL